MKTNGYQIFQMIYGLHTFDEIKRNFIHFDGLTKQNTLFHSFSVQNSIEKKKNDFYRDVGYFGADQFKTRDDLNRCIWMNENLERWVATYKWGKMKKKQHYDSYFQKKKEKKSKSI